MARLPLLVFPKPRTADRDTGPPPRSTTHTPAVGRQGERLAPRLQNLQQAFDRRSVEIQQETAGINPEQVLVIETVGSVEKFATAVARLDGLEWLGEIEIEEIAPDDDFYDTKKKSKTLNGRLYLLMSNQAALSEMLTLWDRYQRDQSMKWPLGLTKFRDLFLLLHDIRRWSVEDRLNETSVIEAWQEDLTALSDEPLRVEIELWYRGVSTQRADAERAVVRLIQVSGGRVVSRFQLEEIAYHGLLAELPRKAVEEIIQHRATALVKCDSVMFFRPVGQIAVGKGVAETGSERLAEFTQQPLPSGDPVIAILDGMPLENHALLAGRIRVDDPDDFAAECPVRRRVHGTAMCSLVIHGDLNAGGRALSRPVYIRPVLQPIESVDAEWPEVLPPDILPADLIHRAVRRICEGDGNEPPVAPSIKIISFSIGDSSRPFFQLVSSLARLLDWLSHRYGVLFVVSAGNQYQDIDLEIDERKFRALSEQERESLVVRKLFEDARNRRLLSPAESINAVTVGALHHDSSEAAPPGRLVELFPGQLPSPVSAFGTGYRRSVKPDVTFSGGRVKYNYAAIGSSVSLFPGRRAPGHLVAVPGDNPGDVRQVTYAAGTSNAAALISRELGFCHETLQQILDGYDDLSDVERFVVPILKAMIIHGCVWYEAGDRLKQVLAGQGDWRSLKHWVTQWLGFGVPDTRRVMECTEQRATVLGFGSLADGKAHVFEFPLPPSLSSRTERRRLTVTLAWLSPVRPGTQKYRAAGLWFDLENANLTKKRLDADHNTVRRGTVQHEVFEGEKQAAVVSDGDTILIKVNCRADAGKLPESIHYGLAVSLEVAADLSIPVYQEVRTRIRPGVEIRTANSVTEGKRDGFV